MLNKGCISPSWASRCRHLGIKAQSTADRPSSHDTATHTPTLHMGVEETVSEDEEHAFNEVVVATTRWTWELWTVPSLDWCGEHTRLLQVKFWSVSIAKDAVRIIKPANHTRSNPETATKHFVPTPNSATGVPLHQSQTAEKADFEKRPQHISLV